MGRKQSKCRLCQAPVAWFLSPHTGVIRKFEAKPVDGRRHNGPPAYPVEGRRAWKVADLVEDLRVRRETSVDAATDEAYDMPWYVPHDCPNNPFRSDTQETDRP